MTAAEWPRRKPLDTSTAGQSCVSSIQISACKSVIFSCTELRINLPIFPSNHWGMENFRANVGSAGFPRHAMCECKPPPMRTYLGHEKITKNHAKITVEQFCANRKGGKKAIASDYWFKSDISSLSFRYNALLIAMQILRKALLLITSCTWKRNRAKILSVIRES